MKISKLIPNDKLERTLLTDLHKLDGACSGKTLALVVRSIGQAMCQPEDPYVVDFGHPHTPVQVAFMFRAFMRKSGLMFISTKVTNNQVVLEYRPWRSEFKDAGTWEGIKGDVDLEMPYLDEVTEAIKREEANDNA